MYLESTPTFQGHWVLIQENYQWGPLQSSILSMFNDAFQVQKKAESSKQSKSMNLAPSSASVFVVGQLLLCAASVLESNDRISCLAKKQF